MYLDLPRNVTKQQGLSIPLGALLIVLQN